MELKKLVQAVVAEDIMFAGVLNVKPVRAITFCKRVAESTSILKLGRI